MILNWLLSPFRLLRDGTALHRTLSLGYLRQHWLRTALVVASVALGVATLVATRSLNATLEKSGRDAVNPLAGKAHLVITNGQTGVPLALADKIEAADNLPELRDVHPMVLGRVIIPELDNRSVLVIGLRTRKSFAAASDQAGVYHDEKRGLHIELNAEGTKLLSWLNAKSDPLPAEFSLPLPIPLPVLAGPELAKELEEAAAKGTSCRIRLAGIAQPITNIGSVQVLKDAGIVEKNVLYVDARIAAKLIYPKRPTFVTQINLTLDSPQHAAAVRPRIQQIVGPAYHVRTVDESFEIVRDLAAGLQLGFSIGGAGALVIGLFLVYNALSVSVAERRHDIGILRSVGATRGQVAGLFVGEAALLGLLGSLIGVPLGYGLAWVTLGPMSRMLSSVVVPLESTPVEVSGVTVLIAIAAGVATTIFAALVPSVQASLEEPADAVRRVPVGLHLAFRLAQFAGAVLLIGAGFACVAGRAYLPLRWGVFFGLIFVLVGVLVATPLLSALLTRLLRPLFRRVFGLEGRLAADNLARSPGRTGIVIAALAATVGLMVETSGFIRSSEEAILEWLDESIAADLFVTAGGSLTYNSSEIVLMDESVVKDLRAIPEVAAVLPIRLHYLEFRDRIALLIAIEADAFAETEEKNPLARNLATFPRLSEPGTAVVSDNFAALYDVKVGQRIALDGPEGPLEVEIIGTTLDYSWNRGTILVNRMWYREHYRDTQVTLCDVYLKRPEDRAAAKAEIERCLTGRESVHVVSRAELRDAVSLGLRKVYSVAYAQQSVVGLVAMLGVISALFISVLQRRRELGLLRAVGASQGQVLRSVLAEAFQMGVIGGAIGFGVGLMLEWYVIYILLLDESGFVFPLRVPWTASGVVFVAAVLTASLAGLWPAWHATRIRIAEAIAYE